MVRFLAAGAVLCALITPAAALDCTGGDKFACLKSHAEAELKRLKLSTNTDQQSSLNALTGFDVYLKDGPEAATKAWEAEGLPVYDLLLTLLLARKDDDASKAALATTKSFGATNASGEDVTGKDGFEQMKKDLASYYHGEEDMTYARACVSDEAFADEIGGSPAMRQGACRTPYDVRSVQRAFGMMQLLKGQKASDAFEATMQYAYRVPSCDVAMAVLEVSPTSSAMAEDEESAAWKVLDMATVCAAELLLGVRL